MQRREGVLHFRIEGKGDKVRFIPVGTLAQRLITDYLHTSEHGEDLEGALFRPVRNRVTKELRKGAPVASVQKTTHCW